MTDLPDQSGQATPQSLQPSPQADDTQHAQAVGSMHKEAGLVGEIRGPEAGLQDISGQEIEIPKEAEQVGVKVQPTTIPIPPKVQQMGVAPAGTNIPAAPQAQVVPLTDDQIVQGLKQTVTSSWRWLAEWCVRRLKQLHHRMTKGKQSH